MGTIARGAKSGGGTNLNSGQTADPNEVNVDLNALYNLVNGSLDGDNVATATLPGSKSLRFTEISAPSSPSSNDILVYAGDTGGITTLRTKDAAGNVIRLSEERIAGTGTEIALIGGVVDSDNSQVGTDAATTEKVLHSHSIGANTLNATSLGAINLIAHGFFANTGDNKTLRVRLNGVAGTIIAATATAALQNQGWYLDLWIKFAGADVVDSVGTIDAITAGVGQAVVQYGSYVVNQAVTLTSAWTLDITGQNAAATANDITCRFSRSIWYPHA